ncbi:kinase-like domain-containing protein [Cubamyces lactineus]|nr:kinase-like domain-containing protein [Cubamyces lactineus]
MIDEMDPPSPTGALVALGPVDPEWQPILHVSNQVVLYNPTSHALSIQTHSRPNSRSLARGGLCPYCHRSLSGRDERHTDDESLDSDIEDIERSPDRAPNYFQLLEVANESSRPASPANANAPGGPSDGPSAFRADNMAEGYFKAFFQEVCRLGMGANGSVYLCQHVLDGNSLGYFAVKKVAVGQSHSYLLNTLREVRLLEKLHHPNIITYHHAWLESSQFSAFGPRIPTLHILMQWAEGGSLDDFIDIRLGRRKPNLPHIHTSASASGSSQSPSMPSTPDQIQSRSARIRAFRAFQRAPPEERERLRRELGLNGNGGLNSESSRKAPADWKAVHLLSAEEVHGLFGDVVSGLAFLHDKSILHLDLKPGNVLLTWDEGRLVPRAMLSDFGTSQDMLNARTRSGNTGTLEYAAPESLPVPSTGQLLQVDSKADMWSLGMILHKLLFFRLPYRYSSDCEDPSRPKDGKEFADRLEAEILRYPGFKPTPSMVTAFESRRLPRAYLYLLENLLHVKPAVRMSSERVMNAIKEGSLQPSSPLPRSDSRTSVVALARPRRRVSPEGTGPIYTTAVQDHSDSNVEEVDDEDDHSSEDEKTPFLSLPEPPESPAPQGWSQALGHWRRRIPVRIPRALWVRTAKSSILVLKVMLLTRVCSRTHTQPVLTGAALALAVIDTWFESLGATVVLGAAHAALLALACWTGERSV